MSNQFKKIIVVFGFLLLFSVPVLASTNICLNNVTLQSSRNYTFETDINTKNLTIIKNIDCQFGCDNATHTCRESPIREYSTYFGVIIVLLVIFGVMIKLFKRV